MHYKTYPPSPKLSQYIRFHWILESAEPYTHYGMADVCPELIFHYHGQFEEIHYDGSHQVSFLSGISAPTGQTRTFQINQGFGMFGTYLYPHTLPLILDLSASELTNQMVDLESLVGAVGNELEDQIMNSASHQEMIRTVENFISKRLAKAKSMPPPVFAALNYILSAKETPKVKQLSKNFFLSERQLERQFQKFTGFNPKQFIRIARFHRAMKCYGNSGLKLGDIALDCGYYDQSHFAHDFKQFSGLNPREFFSGESPATLWRD